MKHLPFLLLGFSLCALGGGCKTPGVPVRYIEIHANQLQAEAAAQSGLSASLATNIFYAVVNRLSQTVIADPRRINRHQFTDPARPAWIEYTARLTPEGVNSIGLALDMDGKHIVFRGHTDPGPKEMAILQQSMKLFQEALDERQIKYKIETFTAYGGPAHGGAQ